MLGAIGPGLITAAVVLGPGSVTVASKSGALMGCTVLWALAAAAGMMITFTCFGAKIGMMAEHSLLTTAAQRYGRWVAVLIGLAACFICAGFQTGDNVGVGIALAEMFGGKMEIWAIFFTLVSLALLWGPKKLYRPLEIWMVALVAVMIFSFVANMFRIHPSAGQIALGFVPSVPAVPGLVVALSATTFSVAAAAFQSYLVRAKGWTKCEMEKGVRDSIIGIAVLAGISAVIIITAATVLKPQGIKVQSAFEMARQLEPLLGPMAKWMFLSGLWAAAFSSFIVNAMVGGTLLADGLGIGATLDSFWAKVFASGIMALGTVAAILFGQNPINLLVLAQGTTILGVPLIAVVMWIMTNDRHVVGDRRNGWLANILAAASVGWLLYLSFWQTMQFLRP
ncbi:MAG: divalent metal cation transporter [Lentisphaerota bacterium]